MKHVNTFANLFLRDPVWTWENSFTFM